MAGLGWIHFSDTTRRKVLKIIDLLGESGTIDELGIGVVRNAFSNEMFSGMSTIMTRARYYYTVPYLIIDYLRNKQRIPIHIYMDKVEMDLLEGLTRKYEHPDKEKIIGYTIAKHNINVGKRVDELVRKPSEIYWGGIRQYGIFKKTHSFRQLCDAINNGKYLNKSKDNRGNKEEYGDDNSGYEKWSEIFDVPYRSEWDKLSISLTVEEAEHLRDRISENMDGSLIAEILQHPDYISEFLELKSFREIITTSFYKQLCEHNQKVVKTAVQFWNLLEGAHIRFNILLQNKRIQREPVSFQEKWENWKDEVLEDFDWGDFDQNFLWEITEKHCNIKYGTRIFIVNWFENIEHNADGETLDSLVKYQEERNKKERSKLIETHHENYSNWVGIDGLDYRLGNVQTITRDIAQTLGIVNNA